MITPCPLSPVKLGPAPRRVWAPVVATLTSSSGSHGTPPWMLRTPGSAWTRASAETGSEAVARFGRPVRTRAPAASSWARVAGPRMNTSSAPSRLTASPRARIAAMD